MSHSEDSQFSEKPPEDSGLGVGFDPLRDEVAILISVRLN